MARKLIVLLALGLLVTGCSDPVRVEKANAIRRQSEVQYMATATAVAIERQEADVRIAATATAIADSQTVMAATQGERIARQEALNRWLVYFAVAYVSVLLVAFCICGIGGSVAAARKASLEARLVRLDRVTRTWPIMIDTKTGVLVDLETGERGMLGEVKQVDHRRLVISGQARTTGLLAQAAVQIAKSTRDAKPGDMLAAIGHSVPLLEDVAEND